MNEIFRGIKLQDPVWRTIARKSQAPISVVYSVYLILYDDATPDGEIQTMPEDIASALNEDEALIHTVLDEMDERVKCGASLMHWCDEGGA